MEASMFTGARSATITCTRNLLKPLRTAFRGCGKGRADPTGEKLKLRAVILNAKIELLKWTERKFRMKKREEEKKKRKKGKRWQARTGEDKPSDERNPDVIWTKNEVGLHGATYNKILKPRSRVWSNTIHIFLQ